MILRGFRDTEIEVDRNIAAPGNVRGYSLKFGLSIEFAGPLTLHAHSSSVECTCCFVAGSPGIPWYIRATCSSTVLMLAFSFAMGPR